MENQTTSIESLWDRAKDYIETRAELLKLKAIDKASGIISALAARIFLVVTFVIFLGLFNIGLAIWIGQLVGEIYCGFFIVAGFYALLGLILFLCRNSLIKGPISNSIINKLLE